MSKHISVSTIQNPEFINLQPLDINPLMEKCEIKVLYIGQNRNGSFISRETATEMSKTLRGCPIVGWFIEDKDDFGDHGDQIIIDGEGVKFKKLTKPYGFVSPDAKVWFQFFEDKDDFGNTCLREYLMTEGYLWTGQYEEVKRVIESGNPQSMELDENTMNGHWATDNEKGMEFFIIDDATFSKLCILGEDVEPCFEGASVTTPEVSSNFSKDDNFMKSLFTMMNELKFALNNSKGGLSMGDLENSVVEEPVIEEAAAAVEEPTEGTVENFSAAEDNSVTEDIVENDNSTEEFVKKEEDEEEESSEDVSAEEESDEEKKEEEKEDKYALIEQELSELQNKYSLLEDENKALKAFKLDIENKQKDELISSFYMLSDEDKKDVIENKAQYSLEDIEAKLSVICVRKKVNFNLDNETVEETPTVFNLNAHQEDDLPAWLKAVESVKNNK